jgi:hypothetical protein
LVLGGEENRLKGERCAEIYRDDSTLYITEGVNPAQHAAASFGDFALEDGGVVQEHHNVSYSSVRVDSRFIVVLREVVGLSLLQNIQGVFEMHALILTTSYWLHVKLRKNI